MERRRIRMDHSFSTGKDAAILDFELAPDGKSLAYVSQDQQLVVCEFPSGRLTEHCELSHQTGRRLTFSPDGTQLAVITDEGRLSLLSSDDFRSLAQPMTLDGIWHSLAFYQQDKQLLVTSSPFITDTQASGIHAIDIPAMSLSDSRIPTHLRGKLNFSEFTSEALRAFMDQAAVESRVDRSAVDIDARLNAMPIKIAYASQTGHFVYLCKDETIRIFKLDQNEQPLTIHTGSFNCSGLAVSPDASLIVVAAKNAEGVGFIRLFHTETGRELFSLPHYLSSVSKLCFTSDGSQLIAAGGSAKARPEIVVWGHAKER